MESFDLLGPIAGDLHFHFRNLYYVLLPIFFSLSLVFAWFKNPMGGPDFIESIKRTLTATLLLVGFVEISNAILFVTNAISDQISDMSGFNHIFQMASERVRDYPFNWKTAILGSNDLLLAILSSLSYFFLYFVRYFMVAVYHFGWTFLTILSPLILLFHLFTPKLTINLFRSLIEISSWQIVWSTLSVILKAIPYGDPSVADGSYITLIILNLVVSLSMLGTPLLVHALVGTGFTAFAGSLGPITAATMLSLPGRAAALLTVGRSALSAITPTGDSPFKPQPPGPNRGLFVAESPLPQEPSRVSSPTEATPPPPPSETPRDPTPPPFDPSLIGFSEPTRR